MKAVLRTCLVVVFSALLVICMPSTFVPAYAAVATKAPSVTVTNASTGKVSIKQGTTYNLGVKASKAKMYYASSKPSVVKVTSKGQIKGLKPGNATVTIRAKSGKAKTTKRVKVTVLSKKKYKPIKGIQAKTDTTELTVGKTAKIKTTFSPKNASNKNLVYKTSNSNVVTVNASGTVTAKGNGTAKVTVASAANKKAKKIITFIVSAKTTADTPVQAKVNVKSINARAAESLLLEDETTQVEATVFPSNATNKSLLFRSSDTTVLTVSSSGRVYAKAPGNANVVVSSVDNPQVKATVPITVAEPEYDEYEGPAPDATNSIEIDSSYENRVEYADNVKVLCNADYSVGANNSIKIDGSKLPSDLKNGDVIVFEPTESNPNGAAIKVKDENLLDGVLYGGAPGIGEIFKEIDIESYAWVAADDFTPEPDIEIVGTEEVEIVDEEPIDVMMAYPQSSVYNLSDQGLGFNKTKTQTTQKTGSDIQHFSTKTRTVGGGGKSTSKFDFKYKGVTFSVTLTGKVKYDYDLWGLNELYVGIEAEQSAGIKGKLSDIFGVDDVNKKLGEVTLTTPVPGMLLRGSVWFHLGADGELNLTVKSNCEAGYHYTKSEGGKIVTENNTQPTVKTSAEVNTGFDFVGTLTLLALDIADPAINMRFKIGIDSGAVKIRNNGIRCNDIKLKFAPSVTVGTHQGLLKSLGISYSKKIAELTLAKWHLENGDIVSKCTWRGNYKEYEGVSNLLPADGSMGSWGSSNALRITLQWGAHPEDLDSHLYGPKLNGEYHIYYNDDCHAEGGTIKAFLDIDYTDGYGYETTTVHDATSGLYHFMVYRFNGSGTIGLSGAKVSVYKGNRLLKTFTPSVDLSGDYWYVFAYDAKTDAFYPYNYGATGYDYSY